MGRLPDKKLSQLRALLNSLPGDMADRLCHAAGQGDPVLGRLLDYCRLEPDEAARKLFFAPLAPLSGDPQTCRPSRSYTPEGELKRIWPWLRDEVAPEAAKAARAAAADFDAPEDPLRLDDPRREAGAAILEIVKSLEDEGKKQKRLCARLEINSLEPLRRVGVLLRVSPVLQAELANIPVVIDELNDKLSVLIHARYEAAMEADPDAGVWLLFMIMARMERPWRLLRVFERITKRGDDFLLSRTDMSAVGDALLTDAEHYLAGFSKTPETAEDVEPAVIALTGFAQVTVGMTREIGIRKDGAWGQKLFELRARASAQMENIHDTARSVFESVTPEAGGSRSRRHKTPVRGEAEFERAAALGRFLYLTKDDASRAAAGNAHAVLLGEIRERLEITGQRVLDELRRGVSKDRAASESRLEDIALLMRALNDDDGANVLLRRTAAALAA